MKPRILLVGTFPEPIGGVSVHLQRLFAFLHARGLSCERLDESRVAKKDIAQITSLSPRSYYKMVRNCDLVHIHTSSPALRLAHVLFARAFGRPCVLTTHSLTAPSRSWLARALYRLASKFANASIYVSERVRTDLDGEGPVIPAFLRPGAEDEHLHEAERGWISARQAEGLKVLASNASRLNFFKGQDLYGLDLAIEAMTDKSIHERFACIFVISSCEGAEAYFSASKNKIAEQKLEDRFLLLHGPRAFAGLLRASDIFLRATNTDGDALSVREALWYGKPVVASDCAMRPEGVLTFATRDVPSLKSCLAAAAVQTSPMKADDFGDDIIAVYKSVLKLDDSFTLQEKLNVRSP